MRRSVIVRAATERDAAACEALAAKASGRPAREWRHRLREDLEHAERLLLVARADSRLVGYGRARRFQPDGDAPADVAPAGYYLVGLFVEPDLRRCGIARALTDMRLAWIQERAASAWFFTNAQNVASIELHRRCGFVEVTRAFSFPRVTFAGGVGILSRRRFSRRGPSASP
jgi:ribosomal protein S18 acetylase RimI-like enzyme